MNLSTHSAVLSRRAFLVASACGLTGVPGLPAATGAEPAQGAKAKSTILFVLAGGASHIDTWDMKPDAPAEVRGPFKSVETSAPGVRFCEHLPMLGKQAHRLAVINSVDGTDPTNSHLAYYYHLTGHPLDKSFVEKGGERRQQSDDWPFMGSVVAMKRRAHAFLPNAISIGWVPDGAADVRAGQYAGRLGTQHDPLYVMGDVERPLSFQTPVLALGGDVTPERLLRRGELLKKLDDSRRLLDAHGSAQTWHGHQARARSLLGSSGTFNAFDLQRESPKLRERYGETVNGMALLLARRLVEAGVPFVTVYWVPNKPLHEKKKCASAGTWDTHGNNFECLKDVLLPEFDQCFSALLEDLATRGLLDSTLVLLTSEMGRRPTIGDTRSGGPSGAGRDHWTYCLTDLMAGAGIRGGRVFGKSDKHAAYPAMNRVTPADVVKTVYHAMGITDLTALDSQGRPHHLLEDGEPIKELF